MTLFKLEIEYLFDKEQTSWHYFSVESTKLEIAIQKAEKHFKQLVSNSGWEKRAVIQSIRPRPKANETAVTKTVTPVDLPPARSAGTTNRSNTTNVKRAASRNTKAVSSTKSAVKPKANRANAKPTVSTTTSSRSRKKTTEPVGSSSGSGVEVSA
jgi:hypothetical protein